MIAQHTVGSLKGNYIIFFLNLSYDGGFTEINYDEGGLKVPPPFLFVKTIEKVIRLCTVWKKKLFDWQF